MARQLTGRQRQILEFIRAKIQERGYPPSVREIGEALGLRSSSTVHGHLSRLEEKGFIRRDPTKPRAIEVLVGGRPVGERTVTVPILGRVTAGQPLLAAEQVEDVVVLPWSLVRSEEAFLLRVQGDSMVGAGIHDGDLAIVRRQDRAEPGDIVVALVGDEEATIKRYLPGPGYVVLQPENPALEPLRYPAGQVRVLGKVVGLIRRLD